MCQRCRLVAEVSFHQTDRLVGNGSSDRLGIGREQFAGAGQRLRRPGIDQGQQVGGVVAGARDLGGPASHDQMVCGPAPIVHHGRISDAASRAHVGGTPPRMTRMRGRSGMSRNAESRRDRFTTQIQAVLDAAPDGMRIGAEPAAALDGQGAADYLYEERVLLARPMHDDASGKTLCGTIKWAANAHHDATGDLPVVVAEDKVERLANGLLRLPLQPCEGGFEARKALDWIADSTNAVRLRDRNIDPSLITHNHLVSICHTSLCPADEPYPVTGMPDRFPLAGRDDDGSEVIIKV